MVSVQNLQKRKIFQVLVFHFTTPLVARYRGVLKPGRISTMAFFCGKNSVMRNFAELQENICVGISFFFDKLKLCRSSASLKMRL